MRGRNDVVIGVGSAGATMAIGLTVVPIYVRLLGVEAYGLVGFLALLQGSLQVLDMGLAPAISREAARAGTTGSYANIAPLLRTLSRVYIAVGLVIALALIAAAPAIAGHWLRPDTITAETVTRCVMIMGVILACRWPVGIYNGALIGAHHVRTTSLLMLAFSALAQLGGALLVVVVPSIQGLFFWQAAVAFGQLLAFRAITWRLLRERSRGPFDLGSLRSIWRFSAGMSALTVLAVILSQLDRVIVSKVVSLEQFGIYALASAMGRALYGLINPVYNVVYPRFTALVERGEEQALSARYGEWSALFAAFFFPASMAVIVAAEPLAHLWSGDAAIARKAAPLISLIAAGSALHGAMYFPFAAQVASGDAKTPVLLNAILVALYVPLLIILISVFGVFGAALAWCLLFALYVPLGTWITHRKLLRSVARRWLLADIGIAWAVSTVLGALTFYVQRLVTLPDWAAILLAGTAAALAVAVSIGTIIVRYGTIVAQV